MAHDVFVSYSSIDKASADAACAVLEAGGIRCWIAPRDISAGAEWADAIITAIEGAKVMVLVFSSHANESRQVRREIELAVNRGITIMPLRLEEIEPTRSMAYYMAGVHWMDALTPPLDAHLKRLAGWIRPHLDGGQAEAPRARREPPASKPAEPPPKPKRARPAGTTKSKPEAPKKPAPKPDPKPAQAKTEPPKPKPAEPAAASAASSAARAAEALFDEAYALSIKGRTDDAIATYRRLIETYGSSSDPAVRKQVLRGNYNLASRFERLARYPETVKAFDETLARTAGSTDQETLDIAARASYSRGNALSKVTGRMNEAIAVYDRLIALHGKATSGVAREVAGAALSTKAIVITGLGRTQEGIKLYGDYLVRYGRDPALAEDTAEAMFNLGVAYGSLNQSEKAVNAYEAMLQRFRGATEPKIREFVAKALYNKANRLAAMKRQKEALAVFDEYLAAFGTQPLYAERTSKALINKAFALAAVGLKKEANATAAEIVTRYAGSPNPELKAQVENAKKFRV